MKKRKIAALLFGGFCLTVSIGCMTMTGKLDESVNTKYEKVFTFDGFAKDQLFDIINQWAVQAFNKADSVIEYSSKESGTIMGKFVYKTSAIGLLGAYTLDGVRNIITINVRDGAARMVIEFSEIHVTGSGVNMWRAANKGEFESANFMENSELVARQFENYVKNFVINSTW
jgi:hypothetical protein